MHSSSKWRLLSLTCLKVLPVPIVFPYPTVFYLVSDAFQCKSCHLLSFFLFFFSRHCKDFPEILSSAHNGPIVCPCSAPGDKPPGHCHFYSPFLFFSSLSHIFYLHACEVTWYFWPKGCPLSSLNCSVC